MSRYYYFVASLPTLRYEDRDAMSPDAFIEWASEHVDADEIAQLRLATIDAPEADHDGANPALASWLDFERGVRNALARVRAQRAGKEVARYVRLDRSGEGNATPYENLARDAFSAESPLTGEDLINRARFAFAEDLEVNHFFDLDVVIAHYIKLQVIARRKSFSRREGEERFASINEQITNEYYQETKV